MSDKNNHLTQKQYDELQSELDNINNVLLPQNSRDIGKAVEQGDLSENAEYDAAKEEQGRLNSLKSKIESQLANAVIIKKNENTDIVEVGHEVTVENMITKEKKMFTLLGKGDGKTSISVRSPLGESVYNKRVGDVVTFIGRKGERKYKILDIQ